MSHPPEHIPDDDLLYKWVPRSKLDEDADWRPDAMIFRNKGVGMSTSWSRHCTAEECREGLVRHRNLGVVSLPVGEVRADPNAQAVRHTPKTWPHLPKQGDAHTDVVGEKDAETQLKLQRIAIVRVKPDPRK